MSKRTAICGIVVSFFLGAAVSACDHQTCPPNSVRSDTDKPGRYWVCNSKGTKEAPYEPPTPSKK